MDPGHGAPLGVAGQLLDRCRHPSSIVRGRSESSWVAHSRSEGGGASPGNCRTRCELAHPSSTYQSPYWQLFFLPRAGANCTLHSLDVLAPCSAFWAFGLPSDLADTGALTKQPDSPRPPTRKHQGQHGTTTMAPGQRPIFCACAGRTNAVSSEAGSMGLAGSRSTAGRPRRFR